MQEVFSGELHYFSDFLQKKAPPICEQPHHVRAKPFVPRVTRKRVIRSASCDIDQYRTQILSFLNLRKSYQVCHPERNGMESKDLRTLFLFALPIGRCLGVFSILPAIPSRLGQ